MAAHSKMAKAMASKPMKAVKAMQTSKAMKTKAMKTKAMKAMKGTKGKDKAKQNTQAMLPMQPTPPLQFMAIHCTGKDCHSWVWLHRLATMGSCQVCGKAWATSLSNIQLHL